MQEFDAVVLPFRHLVREMTEGNLSSVSLVQQCLHRIEKQNARLNAFVKVFENVALERARELDEERAAGRPRGPLHGIPIAIKDLADIAGEVTGFGSRAYSSAPATRTAPFIEALERAGMVVIGKTQMVEFAFGSWGTNHALGTPWNPHDRETHCVPGGSSSGSAVAVAARLVPAAIGSDTGGSVRIPAALCGIVGLKTTAGLVSTEGVAPLSPTLDTIGPMTRHVDDARLIFEAIRLARDVKKNADRIRLRSVARSALKPLDRDVLENYESALASFRRQGFDIAPVDLPRPFADYQADCGAIMAYEAYSALNHLIDDASLPLDAFVRARVLQGAVISPEAYERRLLDRRIAIDMFRSILAEDEVLVLPATPHAAIPLAEVDESTFPMSRYTRIANYLELCGLSVPSGRSRNGMPLGLQLVACGGAEALLLDLAERIGPY